MLLYNHRNQREKEFYIQWHLTDRCDMRCKHCYIPNVVKNNKLRMELTVERCKKIIDNYKQLLDRWGLAGCISFTGGNPLMYKHFFEIAGYASEKNIRISVLGNPSSVMDSTILTKLKKIRLSRYQISIDGLEEAHDRIRGKGSYSLAIKALDNLMDNDISVVVLSTISKENYMDIPKLAKLLFSKGVAIYDFTRVVPIGQGIQYEGQQFSPSEYRDFLLSMFYTYLEIKKDDPRVMITFKDMLWTPLLSELGLLKPIRDRQCIQRGCSIGINGLTIDVDGTVYSCRRLEEPVGDIKESTLEEIFINSPKMNEHRKHTDIEGCNQCQFLTICRGCRAIAYAVCGNYYSKDPQCWRARI